MNATGRHREVGRAQRGMALVVAMIVLIGVTLISLAGINTSILELRMARNVESQGSTFQMGLAVIDFILQDPDVNLPTAGALLVPQTVTLPTGGMFDTATGEILSATATRLADCAPPPRARDGSSITAYSAFLYEASGDANYNATGLGRTVMNQGYVILGPKC